MRRVIEGFTKAGTKRVSFKPGSVDGIRQVVNIAISNPHFPIILQWTGGRASDHHSCEDVHRPILSAYSSIHQHRNIMLVSGSGFGGSEDLWQKQDIANVIHILWRLNFPKGTRTPACRKERLFHLHYFVGEDETIQITEIRVSTPFSVGPKTEPTLGQSLAEVECFPERHALTHEAS
ncbi:hypothetical protein BDM02DRAFT_2447355 [Thelephora ganbajun]|uniref:Uncharacterized protein n=1 Tax=Thelephora ganbajun TaxID=370292 RepID=A0ACB6YXW5_THEGA|nr:hypothetical protein BDM02DRAFT_2447355 [Thelephora ganbajun]